MRNPVLREHRAERLPTANNHGQRFRRKPVQVNPDGPGLDGNPAGARREHDLAVQQVPIAEYDERSKRDRQLPIAAQRRRHVAVMDEQ